MKKLYSSLLLLFSVSFVIGQMQIKLLEGRVVIDEPNPEYFDLDGIVIQNLNKSVATATGINGGFSIDVSLGDSLSITSGDFVDRKIYVNERIWERGKLVVHLNEDRIELGEAEIRPFDFSGYLEQDVKRLLKQPDSIVALYNSLGIDPAIRDIEPEENLDPLNFWEVFPLTADLGRISQFISGDIRRKRNLKDFLELEERIQGIIDFFGKDRFNIEFEIPDSQIHQFVLYCYHTEGLKKAYDEKDFFKIQDAFEKHHELFVEQLKMEGLYIEPKDSLSQKSQP